MRVLGIETSCDETGLAVYDTQDGLLGHVVHSQIELHQVYGGVVPELASRDHIKRILPLIRQLLDQTGVDKEDLDGVAYTAGPGLVGALLAGAAVGRSLAFAWGLPAIPIHHLEGHLLAPLLEPSAPSFPFAALLVSGGHTLLVNVSGLGDYQVVGESLDDAVGEAFDKTAKLLGLGYPGGPALERLARQGNPQRFRFPRPMTDRPGLDFSFSGLKTFALNTLRSCDDDAQTKADIACAFQQAAIDTLLIKCRRMIRQSGMKQLVVSGGVSANSLLRQQMQRLADDEQVEVFYPRLEFCTDNGAMIAFAGSLRLAARQQIPPAFNVRARWPLDMLDKPA